METQAEWEAAFLKSLGSVVRRERLERGVGQEQLADASRVHENTIRLLEQGRRMPSVLLLLQVAAGLKVSAADLLQRVEAEVGPIPWTVPSSTPFDPP